MCYVIFLNKHDKLLNKHKAIEKYSLGVSRFSPESGSACREEPSLPKVACLPVSQSVASRRVRFVHVPKLPSPVFILAGFARLSVFTLVPARCDVREPIRDAALTARSFLIGRICGARASLDKQTKKSGGETVKTVYLRKGGKGET